MKKTIYDLEKSLMSRTVRRSAQEIDARLCEGFTAFCSSGKVYRYQKGDVFAGADTPDDIYDIMDFSVEPMGDDAVLATYRVICIDESGATTQSLHSSIWRARGGAWKLWFHQGTKVRG